MAAEVFLRRRMAAVALLAVLAGRAHASHLRILALGDSIKTGGGYPVHILPEETGAEEASSLLEALDVDADGQVWLISSASATLPVRAD